MKHGLGLRLIGAWLRNLGTGSANFKGSRACALTFASILMVGASARAQSAAEFDRLLDSLPIVDEINTAVQPPVHQFPPNASQVATVLGRSARVLPADDIPKVMAWIMGADKALRAGAAYVLEVEYPDDVPRTLFVANRGADFVRGFATGTATGDARQQYT